MWTEILKISSVIAISGVKFLGGAPLALAYHFSFLQTILYTSIGGISGVILVTYFSRHITAAFNSVKSRLTGRGNTAPKDLYPVQDMDIDLNVDVKYLYKETPVIQKKKIFTGRNRRIVKLKVKYGLIGIALLTPVILSIPIGTFIATKVVSNKKKVVLYLSVSILLWAFFLTSIFAFFWK